jgi:hypothetical protein
MQTQSSDDNSIHTAKQKIGSSLNVRLSLGTILTTENPLFEMCTSFRVRYGIAILPICTSMKNFPFRSQAKSFGNNLNKRKSAKSSAKYSQINTTASF